MKLKHYQDVELIPIVLISPYTFPVTTIKPRSFSLLYVLVKAIVALGSVVVCLSETKKVVFQLFLLAKDNNINHLQNCSLYLVVLNDSHCIFLYLFSSIIICSLLLFVIVMLSLSTIPATLLLLHIIIKRRTSEGEN